MKNLIKLITIAAIVGAALPAYAQKKELSLEQLFKGQPHNITKDIPTIWSWVDNTHYVEGSIGEDKKPVVMQVDIKTGKKTPNEINITEIVGVKKVGNLFEVTYYDTKAKPKLLMQSLDDVKNPTLSPDKQWVAFTRNNNLFSINLATGEEIQYTADGSDVILNGYASWVYYEEILGRPSQYRTFWWSPDSKHLAFFRSDDSKVPVFPIYIADGQHGYLENQRYPKAGDPNPTVKTGIVSVNGGAITWADFNEKDDQYFGLPFWTPDSKTLVQQWMPREQNNLKMYAIDPATGSKKEIYNENQNTWVDWKENVEFLANNAGYIVINDTDGWEQLYLYNMDGTLKQKLTTGKLWKTKIVRVDEAKKTIYFTSCAENSTRNDFYSVKLDGKEQKRLTFGEYTHKVLLSPDAKYFVTTYSNLTTPPKIALVDVAKGKIIKEIADAKGAEFDNYAYALPKMEWIQTPDGFNIPAVITMPVKIDPTKKYPVLISIYGGPNAGTVSDGWKGIGTTQWLANEGLIQIAIDHRGSGHCGKAGLNYLHRNIGKWEIEDYIQWVKWLQANPNVDPKRIAIQGGSYGGYVTALALTKAADYFNYGIADFGVMDWTLYDSHYTERYMDTPESNPEGYKSSSVFTYLDKYKSGEAMLRIVHGSTDDNVHMQNSIQLIEKLQNMNKVFEMMIYPNCRHGWGNMQRTHDRNEKFRFYYRYLLQREAPKALFQ